MTNPKFTVHLKGMKLPPGGNGLETHHQPTSRSKIIEVFTNQIPTLPLQAKERGDIVGCSGSNLKCCGLTREREARGQIGVRRVLVASDEATPYSGLEARHLPLLAGLAGGCQSRSQLSPARCGKPAKKASHVEELWLSWCQPADRPLASLHSHSHYLE